MLPLAAVQPRSGPQDAAPGCRAAAERSAGCCPWLPRARGSLRRAPGPPLPYRRERHSVRRSVYCRRMSRQSTRRPAAWAGDDSGSGPPQAPAPAASPGTDNGGAVAAGAPAASGGSDAGAAQTAPESPGKNGAEPAVAGTAAATGGDVPSAPAAPESPAPPAGASGDDVPSAPAAPESPAPPAGASGDDVPSAPAAPESPAPPAGASGDDVPSAPAAPESPAPPAGASGDDALRGPRWKRPRTIAECDAMMAATHDLRAQVAKAQRDDHKRRHDHRMAALGAELLSRARNAESTLAATADEIVGALATRPTKDHPEGHPDFRDWDWRQSDRFKVPPSPWRRRRRDDDG